MVVLAGCETLAERSLRARQTRANAALRDLTGADAALLETPAEEEMLRAGGVGGVAGGDDAVGALGIFEDTQLVGRQLVVLLCVGAGVQRGMRAAGGALSDPSLADVGETGELLALLLDEGVGCLVVFVSARLEGPDDSATNLGLAACVEGLCQTTTALIAGEFAKIGSAVMRQSRREMRFGAHLGRQSCVVREDGAAADLDSPQVGILLYAAILVQPVRAVGLTEGGRGRWIQGGLLDITVSIVGLLNGQLVVGVEIVRS